MTTRTWIGGANNKATNGKDWSPTGVPQPGDDLLMTQGVMDIAGNALAGDQLTVSGGTVTINTHSEARLDLHASFALLTTADVNVHGTVMLTADVVGLAQLNISGGKIHFIGSSSFTGLTQVFDDNLVGSGTLNLSSGNHLNEHMEINGEVGRGLTFNLTTSGPPFTSLQIDHPGRFHGLINIVEPVIGPSLAFGYVALMGLHATSADIRDDILLLFDGKRLVDTTRLSGGIGLKLEQNSQGVMLSEGAGDLSQPGGPGTIIPLHTSVDRGFPLHHG
jgi:hypothetical protein